MPLRPSKRTGKAAALALSLGLGLSLVACARDPQQALNRAVPLAGLDVTRELSYGPDERQTLDVYAPRGVQGAPLVLFIHGGSWDSGDKSGYKFLGESLARAGYVTAVMNYRLAPRHRYPDYVQDAARALAYLRQEAKRFGASPDNLFLMGHSAGAFNAVEVAVNERWLAEAGVPVAAVRGVIGVAGPYSYDFRQFPSAVAFPEGSTPDDVMPDRHVRPDAPPHLLLVAADDTTVHPQNALNMEAALRRAGAEVSRVTLPRLDHITVIGVMARALSAFGGTRQAVLDFIEARRL